MTNYDYVISDLPIYKAALHDDWDSVSERFEQEPELMTKQITYWWETPLHIAVGTDQSHRFVEELVKSIVAAGEKEKLFIGNYYGNSPLQYAAKVGNTTAVRLLVEQDPDKALVPNSGGNTPVKLAAWHGNKEALKYLLTVTRDLRPGEDGVSPYTGVAGGDLITLTIMAGFYDVALDIINMHPNIVLEKDRNGQTALQILAQKPEVFPSGSGLGFWGRLVYSLIHVNKSQGVTQAKMLSKIFNKFTAGFWSTLQYVAPTIKNIHDIKVNNKLSRLLVDRICKIVIEKVSHEITWNILGSAITTAVNYGIHELIEECIITYPGLVWYNVGGYYLFLAAIIQRQERVYNLVYQMSRHKIFAAVELHNGENTLHIAAKLAPPHRLTVVTGAALQMQRELQWFQEVEKFIEPSYKEAPNNNGQTPRMVFTDAHKDLLKDGWQWMKDTATSCTVIGALIITMTFAAGITLPGGNQDDGKPVFLNKSTFMLFMISNAIALFSSSTSVLMFLGILTSRYAEADFLYALPKRLTIGLLSLFMSIATSMIAFSSALALVLNDKVTWIAAPLVIATSIPVCLFSLLQFPLLVELVKSTYGRSIFHRQNKRMIH